MVQVHKETVSAVSVMSIKKKQLFSTAMKRTSEWISSQEIPSDITVKVGGAAFSLHKFPLVSKCGYIRKVVSEANDSDLDFIEIPKFPGGAESFEFTTKFCYGINFEISIENIAMIYCAAEYLEMTEEYAVGNLMSRTEAYLNEVALRNLSDAVSVLHSSEPLLPMAEKVKLVSRCIDAIALLACRDSQFCSLGRADSGSQESLNSSTSNQRAIVDWWAEDLTILRIDIFQRVLMAMKARGFKQYALGPILMLYAQKSLRGLDIFGRGKNKIEPKEEHEKRVILETLVSLLPMEKHSMSVSFLSMLLRAALYLETTVACRLDLEKRMGHQLGQAALDDLLIPSFLFSDDTLFDVDTVQRILMNFLEHETDVRHVSYRDDDDYISPSSSEMERVVKLMESYLAEIATDPNLTVQKFVGLAELVPEQARVIEDGMYRAIDIFLKAHRNLSDMDRKKICSVMDCQKLSREACAHAAQNDRLPVQTVVQVLYYEQQRLRDAMSGTLTGRESPALPPKIEYSGKTVHGVPNLERENQDLKLELVKMKMRLKELEKPIKDQRHSSSADKPPLPKKSFINSVSKKLGRFSLFTRGDGDPKLRLKPAKDRRHSIS
ncbi:BTB/POZ domain-containing protein SR1IP1-like isoform X1 [Aristolochia californica]|uniref:BTB/POZ domain-containing protein SR1IP1-like isoform X1 n=1 Tax=Aristolochia californica TaxID=171875 RepID=UPI0035DB0997